MALPLALAFGVASGATAAAGLVTAILAGLIIGALSGAPYQISGPTGAMSAVLIIIAQRVGVEGVWMTGLIAGAIILVIGLLRMGRFVAFIPSSVISGFTSGIAFIIFVGQIDNFLGVETAGAESAGLKLFGYLQGGFTPAWPTLLIGLLVVGIMIFWPARFNRAVPGSLVGIVVATVVAVVTQWPVASIGAIPRTILLDQRLTFATIPWEHLNELIVPALSVAALGAVESLLCGAVGSKMTGIRLQANQELVAQGIGNLIIPFFGGVPATAAIARSSVGIKSGGQTRLVSIIHALALLAAALLLAPVIALTPLTALAGVLTVTAVRMNEWDAIGFMFSHRFKTGIVTFLITFLATITLDLTQAIIIGGILSAGIFINQVANLEVEIRTVDVERMRARGMALKTDCQYIRVAFLTGPLFFAATNTFNEAFAHEEDVDTLVLSMRAVPLIDLSGIEALHTLHDTLAAQGKTLMLAAMHPKVMRMLERAGLDAIIGKDNFFWSADRAILIAEARHQHLKPQIVDEIESSQVVEPLAMPI
ncbi:MAG: SulP family inorganic anion transporter [Anaerolineales bacterium]|nr:SulP family inorganic anion transporter [Anaerolineales bacterium]